tara:strand:+ start:6887 stop:7987 length:1101 start_codon:yes stop_codon:yes gene_type:complete
MKVPFVDLHLQYLSIKKEIDDAIASVIKRSAFIRSEDIINFENHYAAMFNTKNCVSCANGTDALHIAMKSLGLKEGQEVITTAHSWISTSETITQTGGKVVFCDTEKDSFNIDPDKISELITDKTVGIIPVHLYGQACNMEKIMKIASDNKLWIIEDCAQAHFSKYKNQYVGTFGDASTFSFYPGKNLGAMGDAGCLLTNNNDLADHALLYARHGGKNNHKIEGINSRLDGIQAAILNVKLNYILDWTEKRRSNAGIYNKYLKDIPQIQIPKVSPDSDHVYHLYVIKAEDRDLLKAYLSDAGVSSVLNYPMALPFYEAYKYLRHSENDFPNAFENQSQILSLPMFPEIVEEQIAYVSKKIKSFYQN